MKTTTKGDIAELRVAADLVARGYAVLMPFGVSHDYDLVVDREGSFERIQVKYAKAVNEVIPVRTRTHSNTSKGQTMRKYSADDFEWLAVYEPTEGCFYIPSSLLGQTILHLRLTEPKNGHRSPRMAKDFRSI
jgi:hypothetical protein